METNISTLIYAGTAIMVALSMAVIFTVVMLHRKMMRHQDKPYLKHQPGK